MEEVISYRQLVVWQKAMDLVELIYRATELFPEKETYGLSNQMRRAAVSIPSNIAEGRMRATTKEFHQFIRIAYASGAELETQVEIATRLHLLQADACQHIESLLTEVMKMLNKTIQTLNQ